jgi:hypothetical protein
MTPGGTGSIYGANTHGNQGGGNKKQGLPPTIGRAGWLSNFIRTNAGGYFRGIPGPVDPCPTNEKTGNQDVANQTEAEELRGVTKINGYLKITGNITDWSPFDCLKHITGDFNIQNNANLETISGFSNLNTVGNDFTIYNNAALETISGFDNLNTVGEVEGETDNFSITSNANLETISGFGSLTTIGGWLDITSNNKLQTISGFVKLETVGNISLGYFTISNNSVLETIPDFGNLNAVRGAFYIVGNNQLAGSNFSNAFNNLRTILVHIEIQRNEGSGPYATTWTLPTGWNTAPKLNWGTTTGARKLNGGTNATVPGNLIQDAADELFLLPDINGDVPP